MALRILSISNVVTGVVTGVVAGLCLIACGLGPPAEEPPAAALDTPLTAGPAVTLKTSANPSVFSQRIVLTATAVLPGVPSTSITGSMTFSDGASVLGTVAVASGKATFATRELGLGSHDLSASFLQTGAATPITSLVMTQVVGIASTTATIIATRPTANYGDNGAINVTVKPVSPANAIPTGTVDFFVDGGYYWTATLDATGRASLSLFDLYPAYTPGTYLITATYSGDGVYNGATTAAVSQTLVGITTPPVTTVTLNANSQPVFSPTSFTLSSYNPVGCNLTITNSTPNTLALLYGTPGNWKRLPFGNIAPGASGGVGVSLANYTGYFSAMGATNYVAVHCK